MLFAFASSLAKQQAASAGPHPAASCHQKITRPGGVRQLASRSSQGIQAEPTQRRMQAAGGQGRRRQECSCPQRSIPAVQHQHAAADFLHRARLLSSDGVVMKASRPSCEGALPRLANGRTIMRRGELDAKHTHPGGAGMTRSTAEISRAVSSEPSSRTVLAALGMHTERPARHRRCQRPATSRPCGHRGRICLSWL